MCAVVTIGTEALVGPRADRDVAKATLIVPAVPHARHLRVVLHEEQVAGVGIHGVVDAPRAKVAMPCGPTSVL
jgi:hypothetical protein